ncbi:MAG: hypothetical protein ACK5NB_03025 [Flavobacteriaceae bacterium]
MPNPAKIQIENWFNRFEHRFNEAVPIIVGETATEFFKERIIQKNWNGTPWPRYNPYNKPHRPEPKRGSLLMRNSCELLWLRRTSDWGYYPPKDQGNEQTIFHTVLFGL